VNNRLAEHARPAFFRCYGWMMFEEYRASDATLDAWRGVAQRVRESLDLAVP